jgi:hypothetical protein
MKVLRVLILVGLFSIFSNAAKVQLRRFNMPIQNLLKDTVFKIPNGGAVIPTATEAKVGAGVLVLLNTLLSSYSDLLQSSPYPTKVSPHFKS